MASSAPVHRHAQQLGGNTNGAGRLHGGLVAGAGRSDVLRAVPRDVRKLLAPLMADRGTIPCCGSQHVKVSHPSTGRSIVISSSPSYRRGLPRSRQTCDVPEHQRNAAEIGSRLMNLGCSKRSPAHPIHLRRIGAGWCSDVGGSWGANLDLHAGQRVSQAADAMPQIAQGAVSLSDVGEQLIASLLESGASVTVEATVAVVPPALLSEPAQNHRLQGIGVATCSGPGVDA